MDYRKFGNQIVLRVDRDEEVDGQVGRKKDEITGTGLNLFDFSSKNDHIMTAEGQQEV